MEIIVTKIIRFEELPDNSKVVEYPEFQRYITDGYTVKTIYQELLSGKEGKTTGFLITVVLYKPS